MKRTPAQQRKHRAFLRNFPVHHCVTAEGVACGLVLWRNLHAPFVFAGLLHSWSIGDRSLPRPCMRCAAKMKHAAQYVTGFAANNKRPK
jgi:hypothetical protein